MARIRTIKPSFFTSEDVAELSFRARLTWIGLWTHCDDEGRAKDNVKLIKAAVWPLDDVSFEDVEADLAELAERGRIVRYEVDGRRYLEVVNWRAHQKINRPSPSKFPPPPTTHGDDPQGRCCSCGAVAPVDNSPATYPQAAEFSTDESGKRDKNPSVKTHGRLTESSLRTHARNKEGNREEEGNQSARARAREARRWLHARYGLTDDEASQVLAVVERRAAAPIAHPIPYMEGMAEGDLADIVAAVLDNTQSANTPETPQQIWCGNCDENTRQIELADGRLKRCPTCHPLRNEEPA